MPVVWNATIAYVHLASPQPHATGHVEIPELSSCRNSFLNDSFIFFDSVGTCSLPGPSPTPLFPPFALDQALLPVWPSTTPLATTVQLARGQECWGEGASRWKAQLPECAEGRGARGYKPLRARHGFGSPECPRQQTFGGGGRRSAVTAFGQTCFGHPYLAEFGQTEFGQYHIWPKLTRRIWPSLFGRVWPIFVDRIWPDRIWPILFLVGARRGGGPEGWGRRGGGPEGWGAKPSKSGGPKGGGPKGGGPKGGALKGGGLKGGGPKGGGPNPEKVGARKVWAEGWARRVEPEGWSPEGWSPEGWGPKISRFFFPSPATKFVLFFPLWVCSR